MPAGYVLKPANGASGWHSHVKSRVIAGFAARAVALQISLRSTLTLTLTLNPTLTLTLTLNPTLTLTLT